MKKFIYILAILVWLPIVMSGCRVEYQENPNYQQAIQE